MTNLSFRKAVDADCSQIANIHNMNVRGTSISKHYGFLLAQITEEQILQKLENRIQYFVTTGDNNEVSGFVAVSVRLLNILVTDNHTKPRNGLKIASPQSYNAPRVRVSNPPIPP